MPLNVNHQLPPIRGFRNVIPSSRGEHGGKVHDVSIWGFLSVDSLFRKVWLRIWSSLLENWNWENFSGDSSYDIRLKSLDKIHAPFFPQNREDYLCAVDEDDLDISVLPVVPVMVYRQGPSTEDGFDILDDDETGFGRCQTTSCEPNESAQYFNDEDSFGRLYSDSDYEDSEELSEEDILFGSGWDSDDTVTEAGPVVLRHTHRDCADAGTEEITGVAEDDAQYFDADNLFEREEAEMWICGRDEETLCYHAGSRRTGIL